MKKSSHQKAQLKSKANVFLLIVLFVLVLFLALLFIGSDHGMSFKVKNDQDAALLKQDISGSINEINKDLTSLESLTS